MIHIVASYGISLTILVVLFVASFSRYLETIKCISK
ncbi:putative membrane protein [Orientia tsutsugamushi str. Karp]|nr:putative membrane protein [Orientia tsutsugamushi str. Karp]